MRRGEMQRDEMRTSPMSRLELRSDKIQSCELPSGSHERTLRIFCKMVAHMSGWDAYALPFLFFFVKWQLICRVGTHMRCHFGFFVSNGSSYIVPAGSYALPFMETHIGQRLTYPTIISIWQEMAAHISKWQLICRTYTHIAKNTIYIVVVRYGYAYNVICPTIPIYKPSFFVIIQKWFDICLPGQIYVTHVRYGSAMSDICPTIPIYKLSFCI